MFYLIEKIDKLLQELRLAIHREVYPIEHWKFIECDCEGAHLPHFDDRGWNDFTLGGQWGGYDIVAWFRTTVTLPPHLRDQKLALEMRVGPKDSGNSTAEATLYVNGSLLQSIDTYHPEAWLPPEVCAEDALHIALRAWSGVLDIPPHRHFRVANLVQIDEPAERFYYLAHTILQAIKQLDPRDLRRVELERIVDGAVHQIIFVKQDAELFYAAIADAENWLQEQLQALRARDQIVPRVTGVGHAHIDLAWLWRLQHAREKAGRTFATALNFMRQYPDYCFLQASPQLYKFVEQDYPELYVRIKAAIAAGRWEATGGMWVESDCNIPSGESLVRQILCGKRFFKQEFGAESTVLWLPDVFGFPGSLPQLMRQSGLKYFVTTKLSWNRVNRFPYDTFRWRGIDGSEVLAHFVTTPENDDGSWHYTYNGLLTPFDIKGLWDNYQQKSINQELMTIYGWGDGGGGPTKEMLESARVLRDLPGFPRVELGKAEPYLARLAERLVGRDVPVWDGELYLELHRGTFTSQAASKRANRVSEVLYHDAEWFSTLADLLLHKHAYPASALREGWELLLLNQFHDILPGSSIRQVYEESHAQYQHLQRIGRGIIAEAQTALQETLACERESVVVFNSLGWTRKGLIEQPYTGALDNKTIAQPDGRGRLRQIVERDGERKILFHVDEVPALGYRTYPVVEHAASAEPETMVVRPELLENPFYRIALSTSGQITSLFDKVNQREVLSAPGNVLQVFQDKPMAFDAWDIEIYYREKMQVITDLIETTVEETGPLRGVLQLRWRFRSSTITQRLTLYAHSPRIDFRTDVDWHEQQLLLKVAFPVQIRSTRATYEIQWGNIERPTHWNTSWDWARFESVGHRWVDLSEGNYGVALLNDCKYGHDIKDNVLRLTLIKSPIRPDPLADQGRHLFTYSLLPHAGAWRASEVVQQAYDLNYPLHSDLLAANPRGLLPPAYSFAELDADHMIIETIKQAEDEPAWIVRLYEYKQYRNNRVVMTFGQPIRRAVVCNLMEEPAGDASYHGQQLEFAIAPYEIKTFKIWFQI